MSLLQHLLSGIILHQCICARCPKRVFLVEWVEEYKYEWVEEDVYEEDPNITYEVVRRRLELHVPVKSNTTNGISDVCDLSSILFKHSYGYWQLDPSTLSEFRDLVEMSVYKDGRWVEMERDDFSLSTYIGHDRPKQ